MCPDCKKLLLMCQAYEMLTCSMEENARFVPGLYYQFKRPEFIRTREDLRRMVEEEKHGKQKEESKKPDLGGAAQAGTGRILREVFDAEEVPEHEGLPDTSD